MEIQFDLFDDGNLIETFISRLTERTQTQMPRLAHEPLSEYNEHIREEVRFRAIEKINETCNKLFKKTEGQWNNF